MKHDLKQYIDAIKHPIKTEKEGLKLMSKPDRIKYHAVNSEVSSLAMISILIYGGIMALQENFIPAFACLGCSNIMSLACGKSRKKEKEAISGVDMIPKKFSAKIDVRPGEALFISGVEGDELVDDAIFLQKSIKTRKTLGEGALMLSAAAIGLKFGGASIEPAALVMVANEALQVKKNIDTNVSLVTNKLRLAIIGPMALDL